MDHCRSLRRPTRRQQRRIARRLALLLVPRLRVTWTGRRAVSPVALPPPICCAGDAGRRVRVQVPQRHPTTGAAVAWPCVRRGRRPALAHTSVCLRLRWASAATRPRRRRAGRPRRRWRLSVSAVAWPAGGRRASWRWRRPTLADRQVTALLGRARDLLHGGARTPAAWASGVAARPRRPQPTAPGRVLDDGTYQVRLGDQCVIRHPPIAAFDRRLCLRCRRDIHLVDRRSQGPCVCQVWLAQWCGTRPALISRWAE